MTKDETKVWQAIEASLEELGDSDIQAGLAWINDNGKRAIVRAATNAILAVMKFEVKVEGSGGFDST